MKAFLTHPRTTGKKREVGGQIMQSFERECFKKEYLKL
jgi:hypothetical protein